MRLWIGTIIIMVVSVVRASAGPGIDISPASEAYWEQHSLVYAKVERVQDLGGKPGNEVGVELTLAPKLVVSGRFDPGMTPEVTVSVDRETAGPDVKTLAVGHAMLIVLVHAGDKYRVASGKCQFMPGEKYSICAVKDFDDEKVQSARVAIQKLRCIKSTQ